MRHMLISCVGPHKADAASEISAPTLNVDGLCTKFGNQIASDFTGVLNTLLSAYSQIADAMPDFSRIGTAFQDTPRVREVLALMYEDILEFHRRAYKFLRRRGEKSSRVSPSLILNIRSVASVFRIPVEILRGRSTACDLREYL